MIVANEFIRLRKKSDDSKLTGLTVALLPDGATAPGGLIALTQNAGTNWQYDFTGSVVNGLHTLYIDGSIAKNGAVDMEVYVIRGGVITEAEAAFLKDSW